MNELVSINIENSTVTVKFHVRELLLFNFPEIKDHFWKFIDEKRDNVSNVVFDMSGIDSIDSSAVGFLVKTHIQFKKEYKKVILKDLSSRVREVLEYSRLLNDFEIQ